MPSVRSTPKAPKGADVPRRRWFQEQIGRRETDRGSILAGVESVFGPVVLDHPGVARRDQQVLGLDASTLGDVLTLEGVEEEVERAFRAGPHVEGGPSWRSWVRSLPPAVRAAVLTIDVPMYRMECISEIEMRLFGWIDRARSHDTCPGSTVPVVPVEVRTAYTRALAADRREQTLRLVRHVVDQVKRRGFVRRLLDGRRQTTFPDEPRLTRGGIHCEDPESRPEASYGVRSYLEATPVQVVEFVIDFLKENGRAHAARVLDLTAGAGTVTDVVAAHGGRTAERDLGPVRDRTHALDLRQVHRAAETGRKFDLVFIHPPSIGRPHPVGMNQGLVQGDLSRVHPDEWVAVLAAAIEGALSFLQTGLGLLSVLVPEGVRDHQRVLPLPGMADRIVERLPEGAYVVDRRQLRWGRRARQVSLGRARVPTVHLLVARETWP